MVRIAFFIDTFGMGGAEVLVSRLLLAIRDRGFEPVLLTFGNLPLERFCEAHGVEFHRLPNQAQYKSVKTLPLFALAMRRVLNDLSIGLLHSHLFGPVTAGALAALCSRVPHVGTLHDTYIVEERPSRAHLLTLALWLGTDLVCVSRQMHEFYRRQVRGRSAGIREIRNGVGRQQVTEDRQRVRAELEIGSAETLVVSVSRMIPLKRTEMLVRAFASSRRVAASALLIVGDGPELDGLKALANELGIADVTRFTGERTDVPNLLAASDIFVLASDSEGLSMSVLEAMAAGLAVVATDVGANSELLDEGSGRIIPRGDVAALERELTQLISNEELRRSIGAKARERVQQKYSDEGMIDAYCGLYQAKMGR